MDVGKALCTTAWMQKLGRNADMNVGGRAMQEHIAEDARAEEHDSV